MFTYTLRWGDRRVPAPLPASLAAVGSDDRYHYRRLDAADEGGLAVALADVRPDVIVHCASSLRDSPWDDLARSNVRSVVAVLDAVAAAGGRPPQFVLVSSGTVYGEHPPDALPLEESARCVPVDLYGASKLAGEEVARILGGRHEVPVVCARVFNPVGAGLQDRHFAANVAGRVAAIARGVEPGPLQVGRLGTTRDFVDVRDVARALIVLADARGSIAPFEVVNVSSGRETPVRAVLDELLRLGGVDAGRVESDVGSRSVDVARSYADLRRARSLGFDPSVPLTESCRSMLRYYEDSMPEA